MSWTQPQHTTAEIDAAGRTLIDPLAGPSDVKAAREVISNYRSSHSYPLNTFQVTLRGKARTVDEEAVIAQRLKRLSSISSKLQRLERLSLSELQDTAGCRAVLDNVADVRQLVKNYKGTRFQHRLVRHKDYIEHPRKKSGYRSYHLIYRYANKKRPEYNGLQIEIQIRSRLQHTWATAVEVAGTFTQQALKASKERTSGWLRFFKLMASHLAMQEGTPTVEDTPDDPTALVKEIRQLERKLHVRDRLTNFGLAAEHLVSDRPRGHFTLLMLQPEQYQLRMLAFPKEKEKEATDAYLEAEQEEGVDAVLVSVDSLTSLRTAYPNYFLDTVTFVDLVSELLNR